MIHLPIEPSAYIFDLDGTLLDTEPLYTQATQKVMDPYGQTFTMEFKQRVMGRDSNQSARMTIEEFDLPMTPEAFLEQRQSYLLTLFPEAQEIAGAGDYIRHLNQRKEKIGLATSSHRVLCDLKFTRHNWQHHFDTIVCGDDPSLVRGKPAPDIFLLCADRIEVDPETTVAFEDSPTGVAAARAAGMTVVAIDSPYVKQGDLSDAHLIISDYRELLDL